MLVGCLEPRAGAPALIASAVLLAGCGVGHQIAGDPIAASPVASMTATRDARTTPTEHFRIGGDCYGPLYDCRIDGDAVSCTFGWEKPYSVDTYSGTVTGKLSGQTMTGTSTTHQTGHDEANPGCLFTVDITGPVTYVFDPGGTVLMRQGESQVRWTSSGTCSGSETSTNARAESAAPWSPIP